jgi:hypothetical protein
MRDKLDKGEMRPWSQARTESACRIGLRWSIREGMRRLLRQWLGFLWQEKKYWLAPLIVAVLILAGLVFLTQGPPPLSPFMYSVK